MPPISLCVSFSHELQTQRAIDLGLPVLMRSSQLKSFFLHADFILNEAHFLIQTIPLEDISLLDWLKKCVLYM